MKIRITAGKVKVTRAIQILNWLKDSPVTFTAHVEFTEIIGDEQK